LSSVREQSFGEPLQAGAAAEATLDPASTEVATVSRMASERQRFIFMIGSIAAGAARCAAF